MKKQLLAILCFLAVGSFSAETVDPATLKVHNGAEFPGAQVQYHPAPDGAMMLLNFEKGGAYGALERELIGEWESLERVTIELQSSASLIQFRVKDAVGRFYQKDYPLSGDAGERQRIEIQRFHGAAEEFAQWGDGVAGALVEPLQSYMVVIPKMAAAQEAIKLFSIAESGRKTPVIATRDAARYRVVPGGALELPFTEPLSVEKRNGILRNYSGDAVSLSAPPQWLEEQKTLVVVMPSERGFYEFSLPAVNFTCGVIVAPEFNGERDPYFAIDTALSVFDSYADSRARDGALKLLAASGIGTVRDRIVWSALEPERGQFNFKASPPLPVDPDTAWRDIQRSGLRILNVFHDAPAWTGSIQNSDGQPSYRYPRDLVGAAASWRTIGAHWGSVWDALEVWNEPEIGFGDSLPGDRVAAVHHAISYSFAQAGIPVLLSSGVFTGYQRSPEFFDSYIENNVFEDSDLFSLHDYLEPERLENLIAAHRQMLAQTGNPAIPIWITECGMPWHSQKQRAELDEDRHSAAAIAGKSFEGKACGVARVFMFIYSFYQEGEQKKNFGMCDRNFTPQRSFAAYAFSVEILSHKNYVGDVKIEGATLSRAFSDGEQAVVAIYAPDATEIQLPKELAVNAVYHDIDGRECVIPADKILSMTNDLVYVTIPAKRLTGWLQEDTRAMELARIARNHVPRKREIHPVVFQNRIDSLQELYRLNGYLIPPGEYLLTFSAHNLSDSPVTIDPQIKAAAGSVRAQSWEAPVELAPGSEMIFQCRLQTEKLFHAADRVKLRVVDGNEYAAALVIPLVNWKFAVAQAYPLEQSAQGGSWIELTEWMPWASDIKEPNISGRFRAFWSDEFLRIEVEGKDPQWSQPFQAHDAWQGDSVQIGFQRFENGQPLRSGSTEVTAALVEGKGVLFCHLNQDNRQKNEELKTSRLAVETGDGGFHYQIDLAWSDLGVANPEAGETFGLSLLINSNAGDGRCGVLYWGEGIAVSKQPAEYNHLRLNR